MVDSTNPYCQVLEMPVVDWREDEGESAPADDPGDRVKGVAPEDSIEGDAKEASAATPRAETLHFANGAQHFANGAHGAGISTRDVRSHDMPQTDLRASSESEPYGALDLGTNNCRLLIARPSRRSFRVIDAFSRIIRLGEGVSQSGRLSDAAMNRTVDALKVCAGKLKRNQVSRARLVATEACRIAANGPLFLERVRSEVGLDLEILSREDEAKLAVAGCASLIDFTCDYVLVFDIGGGSSELIWLDLTNRERVNGGERVMAQDRIAAWVSLPVGVVTLAERYGGRHVTTDDFEAMVTYVSGLIVPFEAKYGFHKRIAGAPAHMLGTSGTVTTVAGIQLGLQKYDRSRVDGCWLDVADVKQTTDKLLACSYEERIAEPCIGRDRADLVLAGCAILEALLRMWPCRRLRVADRGLREGILTTLMTEDGVYRYGRRRHRGRGF